MTALFNASRASKAKKGTLVQITLSVDERDKPRILANIRRRLDMCEEAFGRPRHNVTRWHAVGYLRRESLATVIDWLMAQPGVGKVDAWLPQRINGGMPWGNI